MQTFKDLIVWQKAHRLVLEVYVVTKRFPSAEQFGLISQMRRAAISIPANIVEGHKRRSKREFSNFISIAEGSLEELKYYCCLARDLGYLSSKLTEPLYQLTEEVGRMLHGLKMYVKRELTHVAEQSPRTVLFALVLSAYCLVLNASPTNAQSTNGTVTLLQETMSTTGGFIGSSNPISAETILGLAAAGAASNGTYTLIGGVGSQEPPTPPLITSTTNVSGTVNDASATVTVNDLPATISGTTFTAAGVPLTLGPNTLMAVAKDISGNRTSKSIKIYLDLPDAQKTPRFPIIVQGTINDPASTVSVNGVTATITSGQFTASVMLVSGLNTLTATATDPAGNTATTSIRVFVPLPTRPPAMPTVGTAGDAIPTVTTQSSLTLGGTKTVGTSIWINGKQVVAFSDATTWTVPLSLVEGDNQLAIVAKDATSVASAEVDVNIIVDNLPPVITTTPPAKTNLNPFMLTGMVDDSLTSVDVNGIHATRTGRSFQASLPFTYGPNTVTITATSPNHYVSTKSLTITLGHIPTIQTAQPIDGTKLYASAATSIQISATDLEGDPIQYQIVLDGAPLWDWSSNFSQMWTPGSALIGLHTVTVGVRDAYGGSNTQSAEVFIVRPPINHP